MSVVSMINSLAKTLRKWLHRQLLGDNESSISSHYWVRGVPVPEEDVPPHFWQVKMECHYCGKTIEVYHHVSTGDVSYHLRADKCPGVKAKP